MEADRFENLIRAVATRSSRRGFAGLLGGLALGGVLALEDQDDGSAKNRRRRSRRHKRATDPFKPSPILPPPPCTALNSACTTASACCDWAEPGHGLICLGQEDGSYTGPCPWVTCAPVDAQKGAQQCTPGTQCCRLEKAPCGDDCQCCGSLTCENGFCAPARTCVELSGSCSSSSVCCRGYACLNGRCVFDQPGQA